MNEPSLGDPPATLEGLRSMSSTAWQKVLNADPQDARKWIHAAARLGHGEAQVVIGQWLLDGHGGASDAEQALQWFLKAAAQKHAMGINMAGRCYENGWGAKQDLARAAVLFRQAADMGLDAGLYNHANQLAAGKGVAQDHPGALELYLRAARMGHAKSMTKAGRYFEDGMVVGKDPAAALDYYRRGAEGGDFRGQFSYAGMLAGQGKHEEALSWLRKVPDTATPAYLEEAGRLLQDSPDGAYRRIGQDMLAMAASRKQAS